MEGSHSFLISFLRTWPSEILLLLEFGLCIGAVLFLLRFFGEKGLYAYIAIAVIAANIQVLKVTEFSFYAHPVALGTVVFSTTYLATDILNEHFGAKAARRGVLLGLSVFLFWTLLMVVTLGYPSVPGDAAQQSMVDVFSPSGRFFIAGVCAYLISQLVDVWIFDVLRRKTQTAFLWLRNNVSTMVSGLIDNTVFSVFAWIVLAPETIGWEALIFTYILGTYGIRVAIAACDTPVMYLSRHFIVRDGV